ncbi:DUF6746 family protein [Parahaliea mediterranea]|uniref:Uncharacterized protein n=1 Tax=Parahaliea mediterranea TaxID=651086 RepID=A0A939DBQ6_9GAMM|nr:DUF6746 family protein [Parahaliea mediterranea]MBN7795130.1 hypothetical protein [Parahaliea mediterranea]
MKATAAALAISAPLLFFAAGAGADEQRFDHYQGAPSATVTEALSNLEAYNEYLATLLAKDALSDADMGKIHQLSYTLENALQRLDQELDDIAATLEEVHLGSEQLQGDRVRHNGLDYLKRSRQLTGR